VLHFDNTVILRIEVTQQSCRNFCGTARIGSCERIAGKGIPLMASQDVISRIMLCVEVNAKATLSGARHCARQGGL
jgi:hypothetical protein